MKTALIVGGSRGIGRECVRRFTNDGYRVAFTYLKSEKEAQTLACECGALAICADSANEDDVVRAVNISKETLGGIGTLVYNSGVAGSSVITDIRLDEWNRMLAVNLTGAFLYARAVIPDMLSRKSGRIINISSMWGISGASCETHYSAAKAGLIGFTKALAAELGPSGITVNAIAPGVINTDMNSHLSKDDIASLADNTPLMRIGEASEIAAAAAFLASAGASFITGDVLNVSGGFVV